MSNNNQDNNDDHWAGGRAGGRAAGRPGGRPGGRAAGRTHISPAMFPVGQLVGDCITGTKTRNDKIARSLKSITRFI